MNDPGEKTAWQGVLLSVQPRIRLTRSFDQRSHSYLGYALRVRGAIGNDAHEFLVGWVKALIPNASSRLEPLSVVKRWRFRMRV